jgi:hypothetical protein
MTEIASSRQLLAALLRWVVVLVPALLLLGFLSAAASDSGPQNAWFAGLTLPALYPGAKLFPVVWSVAYVLMGVALAMVVSARGSGGRGAAVAVFGLHVLLNWPGRRCFSGPSHHAGAGRCGGDGHHTGGGDGDVCPVAAGGGDAAGAGDGLGAVCHGAQLAGAFAQSRRRWCPVRPAARCM